MSISVTQRPSTTISGETSKWNAVQNPIVYKFTTTSYAQPGYRLDIYVFNASNVQLNADPYSFTPTSTGVITANIQNILKANLSADFTGTFGSEIFTETGAFVEFYIKYQEVWTGSAESLNNDSSNKFYAVYASMQVPAAYGGNLAEYVAFNDGIPEAKFLTNFDDLTLWKGYPCLVSAIVDGGVSGNVFIHADGEDTTPTNYSGKLITVDLNEVVTVQQDDFSVKLYKDNTPDDQLIRTKLVIVTDACANPVCLVGRNLKGGMMSWVFDLDQDYTFDYGDNIKTARKVLKAENLTLNQWESLQDFITLGGVYRSNIVELTSSINKTSQRIGNQVYVVDENGNKTGVIVIPTKNTTRTRYNRHSFTLEIEYPE